MIGGIVMLIIGLIIGTFFGYILLNKLIEFLIGLL